MKDVTYTDIDNNELRIEKYSGLQTIPEFYVLAVKPCKISKFKQMWNILTNKNVEAEIVFDNADKLLSFINSAVRLIDT